MWLTDEPSSYREGVYKIILAPPFAAVPLGPDQTS